MSELSRACVCVHPFLPFCMRRLHDLVAKDGSKGKEREMDERKE